MNKEEQPRENQALTAKQINYAREQIENRRKLENTPIEKVWPFLRYCCCCFLKKRKRTFMAGLKAALRRKMELKVPRSTQRIEDDPFILLGYGLNSYFSVVVQLMVMMGFVILFSVPFMVIYASYGDLEQLPGYPFNQYSLGNLGGSSAVCATTAFNND